MGSFGLLGQHLGHSYSPAIHRYFGSSPYVLYEKEPAELERFILHGSWDGLNVTIPYKKTVVPFCDHLSPLAKALGSVNTLVRQSDGTILGDNTDAYGFHQMAMRLGISYSGKKAMVLGTGGASVTVQAVLKSLGCQVVVVSRSGENNYTNLSRHSDTAILVNATPVGMYPNTGISPVALDIFPKLEGVLDLIYNPARTALIQEAQRRSIPNCSGLYMLVAQGAKAAEQFLSTEISREKLEAVWTEISFQTENLILIGMPGCGKSTIGKLLAQQLDRPFLDADEEVEKAAGMSIPAYFAQRGEPAFRQLEAEVLCRLGRLSGTVIATGGGCVTSPGNYSALHQNGRILWLQRDLSQLPEDGRPVTKRDGMAALYEARMPLYRSFSDITIWNSGTPDICVRRILEAIRK